MTRKTKILIGAVPGLILAVVGICCEWITDRTSRGCKRLSDWINA